VDYYFVELGPENDCTPGTDKGSLSPINSTDGGVITLVRFILHIGYKYIMIHKNANRTLAVMLAHYDYFFLGTNELCCKRLLNDPRESICHLICRYFRIGRRPKEEQRF